MPKIRLTKSVVSTLAWNGKQTRYFDTKVTGFGVLVNERSSSYIVQGKAKSRTGPPRQFIHTIGRTDVIRFDAALSRAKEILEDAANGYTPEDRRTEEVERRQKEVKEITLSDGLRGYLSSKKDIKETTAKTYKALLDNNCSDWLTLPMRDIDKHMILKRHAEIGAVYPSQANHTMKAIRMVYNFAMSVHDETILSNPVRILSATKAWYRLSRRRGYIKTSDLAAWFAATDTLAEPNARVALLALLFTGARKEEIFRLRWSDVDLESSEIHVRETKGGEPLDIPICSYLVGQLKEHKEYFGGEWVFPSTKSATGHVTDMRCSMEGMVKRGSPPFNLHDLRRSFQTYCEDLNVPVFTIKRLVGHALPSDVTQGYIQFSMPMLRKRVEAVAAYILRHAGRLNVNKVVDLAEEKKARQEAAGQ